MIKTLHLWAPNMFGFKGGIQVYSGFLLKALEELEIQQQLEVFLKHDRAFSKTFSSPNHTQVHCAGQWPMQLRTLGFTWQLAANALIQKPDLIISTHLNFAPVALWIKQVLGTPYWTVCHGIEAWNLNMPLRQQALQEADKVLAVSHHTRDRLLKEQDLQPCKVVVLPNTTDVNQFIPGPKPQHLLDRHRLTREQPIILTIARLDSTDGYKGYDKLLRALPQVLEAIPQTHYLLVGKGNDRPKVEALVKELGLVDKVTLTGFVPDEELMDYYNLCDVFAMPSKKEGFGIVYLEALACGKPTLGGNQDGAVDALCRGELGALVDPDNVEAIAHTLVQILQGTYPNPMIYQPEQLRQRVIDIYGFEQFKAALKGYLNEFIEANP